MVRILASRQRPSLALWIGLTVVLFGGGVARSDPSVEEIIARSERTAYYQGRDGRAQVTMVITDAQDRERKRRFTVLRANTDTQRSEQKYYVHISYPADLRDTVLMVWKHPQGEDDRWLYLPGLDLVKRIVAGDKRTSFLGSDFFYEDISGRSRHHDRHTLKETTERFYVIDGIPEDSDGVEFSRYVAWIHKKTFLPIKVEFFDKGGELRRVYEALKVENVQGKATVMESRMSDLALGQETLLRFSRVVYDLDIPADIFTERYLRNAPRQFLR